MLEPGTRIAMLGGEVISRGSNAWGSGMHESIFVVDPNEEKGNQLCKLLQDNHLNSTALHSLADLEERVLPGGCPVLILDLDALQVDNRFFRNMRKQNPAVKILGVSSRSFHPELQEAMSRHIISCLSKPVEEEELLFWVKSLLENMNETS
jgi:DNA-binding NtrC family response regulator